MSTDNKAVSYMETSCCASCGIPGVDEIKLKKCKGCYLVRYCSIECQRDHWSQHKRACRNRAAELRDELLFNQPESTHFGDCPICCLPMPLDKSKSSMCSSCCKFICNGCAHANKIRDVEMRRRPSCPFCRKPGTSEDVSDKRRMKRIEANDPGALLQEGLIQGSKGDYIKAFEYYTKAAELGDLPEAHFRLAYLYQNGKGVEVDVGKEIYHLEEAAVGGHPIARHNLGAYDWNNGDKERAVKHWIIAATQGEDNSVRILTEMFKEGFVSKEDLASALRAHQAAVNATKSPQREAAERDENY